MSSEAYNRFPDLKMGTVEGFLSRMSDPNKRALEGLAAGKGVLEMAREEGLSQPAISGRLQKITQTFLGEVADREGLLSRLIYHGVFNGTLPHKPLYGPFVDLSDKEKAVMQEVVVEGLGIDGFVKVRDMSKKDVKTLIARVCSKKNVANIYQLAAQMGHEKRILSNQAK